MRILIDFAELVLMAVGSICLASAFAFWLLKRQRGSR